MAQFLMQRFRRGEASIAVAKYLDDTLLNMPSLAVESLYKELERYGSKINGLAINHFSLLE
jgi:hypothetical protein